jgi:serine/threonine protein kinase
MTFENELVLPQFLKDYVIGHQIPYKTNSETNHTVYACFNSLGELEQKDIAQILPKITDFGAAWKLEDVDPSSKSQKEAVYIIPVQPNYYRSPEVVLGYGWNFSADIWNFGVLVTFTICPEHSCML